ncbi:MAG TPA: winged helix-turn-helix domain-containing protein [Terriglobales bacterium]|jgi:hypothetical protein|nr:winged helix-turn-helix domain-containing protein [Terriglobales bacterium]
MWYYYYVITDGHLKAALREELSRLQEKRTKLVSEIQSLSEKIVAINRLLVDEANTNEATASPLHTPALPDQSIASISRPQKGSYTQVHVYWPATLQSLVELGGRAPADEVIDRVGKKLETIFTDEDREILPSGTDIRWKNRVAWQRYNMIKQGLLRGDSPRGVWEITEKGRVWLAEFVQKGKASFQ